MASASPRTVVFCPESGTPARPCLYNCPGADDCFRQQEQAPPREAMTRQRVLDIALDEALMHKRTYQAALRWALDKLTRADEVLKRSRLYVQNSKFPGNGAMLAEIESLITDLNKK